MSINLNELVGFGLNLLLLQTMLTIINCGLISDSDSFWPSIFYWLDPEGKIAESTDPTLWTT
jgi:hypothetical protein